MDKVTEVNIEGKDYGFVAGQTVKGVSGALASDYVKHIILPEGAEVVEGMLVAVTFVNDNTAGYSGEKTVYSTDGINFYWDSGYTQFITLPPQGCYTITETETQYEYKLSEYPVLVMGDMTKPFCDSRGHPAGGKLWQAGDTVTVINLENRFIALQTTVNEIIQGSSLPVSSGAVYEKCNSLEPVNEVTSGNLHSVTSNAVAGAISSVSNLQASTAFTFTRDMHLGWWQRVFEIDSVDGGQGFDALLMVFAHNSNHVENACLLLNVSLEHFNIVQLGKGGQYSTTSIRVTSNNNYPYGVYIDVYCGGYDTSQVYRFALLNLGGIQRFSTDFSTGNYAALAHTTGYTTTN